VGENCLIFHVLNGESTAEVFKQAGIPGEYVSWREDLSTGRAADDELQSRESWLDLRAEALTTAYELDLRQCRDELGAQEERLEYSLTSDEIVLWFEYDMFCQINLVYLLDWYERRSDRLPLVSMPTIVPLLERGLGTLEAGDLGELFRDRAPVSRTLRGLGHQIWRAYSSSDPAGLVDLLNSDENDLPYLRRSLLCHLSRFPSVENGLNRIESVGLELVASGKGTFGELFREFWKSEGAYGFGDAHLFNVLKSMVICRTPLLSANLPAEPHRSENAFLKAEFELTDAGRAVLERRADQIEVNGINLSLGGAHLSNDSYWRWDLKNLMLRVCP
jgi:hypothetical protein